MAKRHAFQAGCVHIMGGMKQRASAARLETMMSGAPKTAKPLPNRSTPGAKLSPAIVPVERSVAVDPVKDIGIAPSFDDFKPNGDIVDQDGMPGKPSLPARPVLGFHSHVMIPSFAVKAHRKAPCRGSARSSSELDFLGSVHPRYCTAALHDAAASAAWSS